MEHCIVQGRSLYLTSSYASIYRYVLMMFSVMDESFEMTFCMRKVLVEYGSSFGPILKDIIL